MQLHRLAEAPISDRDLICAYSRVQALLVVCAMVTVTLVVMILSSLKDSSVGYYFAGVMLIFLLIMQKSVTACFRPTNWLVRLTDHGLFIKFRSYLNCHFPAEDYTVAFIPYGEIRSARRVDEIKEIAEVDDNRRPTTTTRTLRWLELELAGDSRQLAIALANETDMVLRTRRVGDEKISTRYQHFPVLLPAPQTLRIEWAVRPKLDVILEKLTRHTLVRPAESAKKDLANLENLSRAEQETRLLELAESGDKIGAIAMARRLYGYDLNQAKEFVEGLAGKRPR